MRRNLSDKFVRSHAPATPGKHVDVFDTRVLCFGLRITSTGHKSYFRFVRWPGSKWASRREIGNADHLPLAMVAWDWLAKVELGIDPHEERRAREAAVRLARQQAKDTEFEALAERWFTTIRGQRRGREVETDFRREYVERFRGRPVGEIIKAEERSVVEAKRDQGRDMETGEGGHPAQARNLLGYGKRFFKWVVDNDIIAFRLPSCCSRRRLSARRGALLRPCSPLREIALCTRAPPPYLVRSAMAPANELGTHFAGNRQNKGIRSTRLPLQRTGAYAGARFAARNRYPEQLCRR